MDAGHPTAADVCRICLDATDEALISPCAGCRGSSAYVHLSCVAEFYRSRANWWDLSCPTCKHDYEGSAAVTLGHLGLNEIESAYGPDDRDVAGMLVNLGNAYGRLGDAVRQRDLLVRALAIEEREYGPDHREVAITLTNLGNAYADLGDAARQRELLHRALVIKEREYGPHHSQVAVTLTNLGNAYDRLGDAARQRDLLERALAIKEREYGRDHREVAITLTNLGNAHGNLGDTVRMRDLLERALLIKEREYGPDHLAVAITVTNLAVAQSALCEFGLAEASSERALRLARAALPNPNAIMADLSLSVALVRRAAWEKPSADMAWAAKTWLEATAELRAAVGEATARDKISTFSTSAARFWRGAGRGDVAEWLRDQVGLAPAADVPA